MYNFYSSSSGTGVYYQAMPAVGPDGKNVMKLIPVQKVNGQFYQTPFSTERDSVDVQLKACAKPVHPPGCCFISNTDTASLPSAHSRWTVCPKNPAADQNSI